MYFSSKKEPYKIPYKPKKPEYAKICDNLIKYPVDKVKPRTAQDFSRCKQIRFLSKKEKIWIKKGIISLPKDVEIKKKGNNFEFFFK